jgi:hypothetical protein
MDRLNAIWQWANREGHILRHKDLNAEQILVLYKKECVRCDDGFGWRVVDVSCFTRGQIVAPSVQQQHR